MITKGTLFTHWAFVFFIFCLPAIILIRKDLGSRLEGVIVIFREQWRPPPLDLIPLEKLGGGGIVDPLNSGADPL